MIKIYEIKNRSFFIIFSYVCLIFIYYFFKEIIIFSICSNIKINFIITNIKEVIYAYINLGSFFLNHCFVLVFFFQILIVIISIFSTTIFINFKFFFFFNIVIFFLFFFIYNYLIFPLSCIIFLSFSNILVFNSLNFYCETQLLGYLIFYYNLYNFLVFYSQLLEFGFFCLLLLFIVFDCILYSKDIRKIFYFFFMLVFLNITNLLEMTSFEFIFLGLVSLYLLEITIFFSIILKKKL